MSLNASVLSCIGWSNSGESSHCLMVCAEICFGAVFDYVCVDEVGVFQCLCLCSDSFPCCWACFQLVAAGGCVLFMIP